MSAKIRFIAKLVWSKATMQDWSTLPDSEIAAFEARTKAIIKDVPYACDGYGHFAPLIITASRAWDAATTEANKRKE